MKTLICLLFLFFWATHLQAHEGVILLHGLCRTSSSMEAFSPTLSL